MGSKVRVAQDKSDVVAELPAACSDERLAVEFVERTRWSGEPVCPHCGVIGTAKQMRDRATGERNKRFLWRCADCKKQFTVRVGTVFEDSRIPLRHWCYAFWAACSSKKGVSALQIKRMTGLTYKSALFMMHRIRYAMADAPGTLPALSGTVEVDETYVGGKPRTPNRANVGTYRDRKACVVAMIERDGNVRPMYVPRVSGLNIRDLVREHVAKSARLMTDESLLYYGLAKHFEGGHGTTMHSLRQYVRGDVHTNTVEGYFALLKRGLIGTFHSVSKKHLHRYLAEFQYRYNTRRLDDGARTLQAIRKGDGRRLMYREPRAENA